MQEKRKNDIYRRDVYNLPLILQGVGAAAALVFGVLILVFISLIAVSWQSFFVYIIWRDFVAEYTLSLPFSAVFGICMAGNLAFSHRPLKSELYQTNLLVHVLLTPPLVYFSCFLASLVGII